MVKAVLRRAGEAAPAPALHRRHRRRRHARVAARATRPSTSRPDDVCRAVFFGLGADGTVGANKNSIKIIGEETRLLRPGLLRLRLEEVRRDHDLAPALRPAADPLGVPDPQGELRRLPPVRVPRPLDVLGVRAPGAVFLLNAPLRPDEVWDRLPREVQETIVEKRLRLFVIDAYEVARDAGMGGRINTIMQTCFFAISGVLPRDEAIAADQEGDREDATASAARRRARRTSRPSTRRSQHLHEVARARARPTTATPPAAPGAGRRARLRAARHRAHDRRRGRPAAGQRVPGRRHLADRHLALGEAQHRARDPGLGRGALHPVQQVRAGLPARRDPRQGLRPGRPARGRAGDVQVSTPFKSNDLPGHAYTLQVAPEDCTGLQPLRRGLPGEGQDRPAAQGDRHGAAAADPRGERRRTTSSSSGCRSSTAPRCAAVDVKGSQLLQPLFEFSGACAGCGETPYLKLLTQLFGDRALIANATGCSSIYGGNLPTTPYTRPTARAAARPGRTRSSRTTPSSASACGWRRRAGRAAPGGWSGSWATALGDELARRAARRGPVRRRRASPRSASASRELKKRPGARRRPGGAAAWSWSPTTWSRRASGSSAATAGPTTSASAGSTTCWLGRRDVNVLVLDTEVYSNTGGQQSKAHAAAARSAKFAAAGKEVAEEGPRR